MTKGELESCARISDKDVALRSLLGAQMLADPPDARLWFDYLTGVRDILGNISNDLGFLATLLAKEYLARRFGLKDFDAAGKAQGAKGPDIEAKASDGRTVRCEIKTTRPYQPGFGAQQKSKIMDDLSKLSQSDADYKLMFVTDPTAYKTLCKPYYAQYARGIEIVDLLTGETYCHP